MEATVLIRGINLLRIIYSNYSYNFFAPFSSALNEFWFIHSENNNIIILILQIFYASFSITKDEAEELSNHYLSGDEIESRVYFFNERIIIPRGPMAISNEKEK